MSTPTLQKFGKQLAGWIVQRLRSGQLPFQKLETDWPVHTATGSRIADLVLWINRPSQIAGSLFLFPQHLDADTLEQGRVLAEAIGLGHFVTWEARQVRVWTTDPVEEILSLEVPSARVVRTEDFHNLLDQLLAELKICAVTKAIAADRLSDNYYLNLCLSTIHDILPDLRDQGKSMAAGSRSDEWVEKVPLNGAWLSVWRILTLLTRGKMPQANQVESLERAMLYALSCLEQQPVQKLLEKTSAEPPLGQSVSVRLNHLVCRLRQLGWPRRPDQIPGLVRPLLDRVAADLDMVKGRQAGMPDCRLSVNYHPDQSDHNLRSLVAPQAYLAGRALLQHYDASQPDIELCQQVAGLTQGHLLSPTIAAPLGTTIPDRQSQEIMRIELRRFWPNRRIELPRDTPRFLWETLYLAGLQDPPAELCLLLPIDWALKPGADTVWEQVTSRYRLTTLAEHDSQRQILGLHPHASELSASAGAAEDFQLGVAEPLLHNQTPALPALRRGAAFPEGLRLTEPTPPNLEIGRKEPQQADPGRAVLPRSHPRTGQSEQITRLIFRDGIPRFPQDYLYDYYRPALTDYPVPGPLTLHGIFFDKFLLVGPAEFRIEVDSLVKADLLRLASHATTTRVSIPEEDVIGTAILAAYRRDLLHLWQALQQECRLRQETQRAALNLARRIWRAHQLPPPKLFLP